MTWWEAVFACIGIGTIEFTVVVLVAAYGGGIASLEDGADLESEILGNSDHVG